MSETHMKTIKLIAVDLDGPLLVDTFSPIMHQLCRDYYQIDYTRELERNTFSRPRAEVVAYVRNLVQATMSEQERAMNTEQSLESYFAYRAEYMRNNPSGMKPEVPAFLDLLDGLGVPLVCYGGLEERHMRDSLGIHAARFEPYVCTDACRPGIREILEKYQLEVHQELFIDDVNFVAEHARKLGLPFIGVPSTATWSWQKRDMQATGVPHIVDSVAQVSHAMLDAIDRAAGSGTFWPR